MMKMCRYALITALAIFLAGCAGLREQPAPVEEAKPQPQQPAQPPVSYTHLTLPTN